MVTLEAQYRGRVINKFLTEHFTYRTRAQYKVTINKLYKGSKKHLVF